MKKKVCKWLNSKKWGAIHIVNDNIYACAPRNVELGIYIDKGFQNVAVDEILTSRKKLYEEINNGSRHDCDGCSYLEERDESEILVDKIEGLILHPYNTCNLRCNYCFLSSEKLSEKLGNNKAYVLPVLKHFYEGGLLKPSYSLSMGGGSLY